MTTRVGTSGTTAGASFTRARRSCAAGLLTVGALALFVWLGWRLATLDFHPVPIVALLIELSGWIGGFTVGIGLLAASAPRAVPRHDDGDRDGTYRYAHAVASCVGRTRATDLHQDLRTAVGRLTSRSAGGLADRAMIGVLIDGPRQIALVATLTCALLLGVAPLDVPPLWAMAVVVAGASLVAASHVVASAGRIHFGDRTRWSFATIGEVFSAADRADQAPRRWVGTMGAIVVLNLAIALRGMSDRWTHGLPAMNDDQRLVVLMWAGLLVLGGLYTLRTIPPPKLGNAHVVARRLEERTARHSAIGVAVCLGAVGLLAGVLPGSVDPGADDPARIESPAKVDADDGAGG